MTTPRVPKRDETIYVVDVWSWGDSGREDDQPTIYIREFRVKFWSKRRSVLIDLSTCEQIQRVGLRTSFRYGFDPGDLAEHIAYWKSKIADHLATVTTMMRDWLARFAARSETDVITNVRDRLANIEAAAAKEPAVGDYGQLVALFEAPKDAAIRVSLKSESNFPRDYDPEVEDHQATEYRIHPRWKKIMVGSDGSVWRKADSRIDRGGYARIPVGIGLGGKLRRAALVHRLVLEAFAGPAPKGNLGRHLDGNRANNRSSNLAWGDERDNTNDKMRHGTQIRGSRSQFAKLRESQIPEIRRLCNEGMTIRSVGLMFGVSQATIHRIVTRQNWTHVL